MSTIQNYEEHFVKAVNHHLKMSGEEIKDFAKRCGVSKITMINYIDCKVSPSLKTAGRIINVINEKR